MSETRREGGISSPARPPPCFIPYAREVEIADILVKFLSLCVDLETGSEFLK